MSKSAEIAQIDEINKGLTSLNATLNSTSEGYLKLVKTISDSSQSIKNNAISFDSLATAQKKTVDESKQKIILDKQLATSEKQLKESIEPQTKAILENRLAKQNNLQATKDQIKAEQAAEGSLVSMRLKLKELTAAYDASGTRTKAAAKEISNLGSEIGKAEEATNRHQRGVGAYADSIKKSALEMFSFAGMVALAVQALGKLKDAFLSTDQGAVVMAKWKGFMGAFWNSIVSKGDVNVKVAAAASAALEQMRQEERIESIKIAQIDTEVKLLRLKAATTKDTTEQIKLYTEADKKEDESIKMRSDHLNREIVLMESLWMQTKSSALADEIAAKKVELVALAGDKNIRIQTKLGTLNDKLAKDQADQNKKTIEDQKKLQEEVDKANHEKSVSNEKYVDEYIKQTEKEVEEAKKAADDKWNAEVDFQRTLFKFNEDQRKKEHDAKEKDDERKLRETEKIAEKTKEIQLQFASEAINGIFNLNAAKLSNEMDSLEKEKAAKLSNANLTAAQKDKIDADYAKKEAAIKTKQAKADKLQALFNIGIDTGKGIVRAAAEFPGPASIPLIAWMTALGLLQAGMVAAQPIPKYAKGTQSANQRGIFGEAGREIMALRSGDVMMADRPTYFDGGKFRGAKIYSNPETEKMIAMTDRNGGSRIITDDRMLNKLDELKKVIANKPVSIVDKENRVIGHATSHSQTIYLNRLMRNN